ncbi:MAG: hypothetical protein IJI36_19990 [Kiritimatiellae bacterium]|nr:hypothetical protein [Kiritimatiellia bacterium]
MTRLTIDDLTGDMPEQKLIEALDDDQDGFADEKAFAAALASANARAEAIFGGAVPVQYSSSADYAVRVFLLDILYRRRGVADDSNPWAKLADEQEARLRALASGTEAIDATTDGVIISKPAKIYNSLGVLS